MIVPKISTLNNGFQIISLPKLSSNLISLGILIKEVPKYINKNSNEDENSVAHFLEHMCFKGTKKYSKSKFMQIIENNNFNINAYTAREHALFTIDCINNKKNIYKSVDLLKEMIFNPIISKLEVEKEKQNIKAELIDYYQKNLIKGNLKNIILDFGHQIIFPPDSHLNKSIIGDLFDIESMTHNKIIQYHKKYFTPNNTKFLIAGIHPSINNNIHYYIKNNFNNLKNNNFKFTENNKLNIKYGQEMHYLTKESSNSGVGIFFNGAPYTEFKRYFNFLILEKLLGQYNGIGKGIQLNEAINNVNIISRETFYLPYENNGLFGFILVSDNSNFTKEIVENYLIRVFNSLNEKQVKNAKNKIILELLGIENMNSIINLMAIQYHYYNKILSNKKIINTINSISIDDIRNIIEQLIRDYKKKKYNYIFIDKIQQNKI